MKSISQLVNTLPKLSLRVFARFPTIEKLTSVDPVTKWHTPNVNLSAKSTLEKSILPECVDAFLV